MPDDLTPTPQTPQTPPAALPQLDMSKSVPVLDMSKSTPVSGSGSSGSWDATPPERGVFENLVGGLEKGAAKTVTGGMNLLGRGVEMATGQPKGSLQSTPGPETEAPSLARDIGEGGENMAEWASGEDIAKFGLEGLAKATKIVDLAKNSELVRKTMELAKDHPVLQKIITNTEKAATSNAAKKVAEGVAVGGAQGTIKGAAEGKPGEEGLVGAAGGIGGATVAEALTPLAKVLGKTVGIGTTATEDAMRGFKPNKRNVEFASKFEKAAPVIDAEPSYAKAPDITHQVEAIDTARENWWQQQVKPWVDKHANVPLSGVALHDYIEKSIPPAMERNSPDEAAKMHELAARYMPTKNPDATYQLRYKTVPIGQAEEDIEHYNALVAKTGYWSKMPAERAAMMKADGELAGNMAVANALREELYDRLQQLEPNVDMRDLKATYGALRNVGDELRGQINVQGRQAPTSMKQLIGLVTGVAMGGWHGVAAAGIPFIDRNANTAERLAARAVQKSARPGEEGLIAQGAQKVGHGAREIAPAATSIVAQHADESSPEPTQ